MDRTERVFPAVSLPFGGGRILPSPTNFYLTGEDRLRVVVVNSLSGCAVRTQWRTANPKGDTVPNSQIQTPTSDRTVSSIDYELGVGSLLNVTVFAEGSTPRIGQTYVMVQLVRGIGGAAIVLGTLLAGYVTSTQAIGWPGSPIVSSIEGPGFVRTFTGTTPGPASEFNETVPTGARWELLSASWQFLTVGFGVTRLVNFRIINSGVRVYESANTFDQPAGQQGIYTIAQNAAYKSDNTNVIYNLPSPMNFVLMAAVSFQSLTFNFQVGDQHSALQVVVREWLEVP